MNDEYNMIFSVKTADGKKVIVYNAYLSPSEKHNSLVKGFCNRLKILKDRYDAKIIAFGDLNLRREEIQKEVGTPLKGTGAIIHYCRMQESFTRIQKSGDKIQSSYLDYFVTLGIESAVTNILKPIGRSDHMTIEMVCDLKELNIMEPKQELRYNFNTAKKDAEEIKDELMKIVCGESAVPNLVNYIKLLRNKYKPKTKKKRHIFQLNEKVRNYVSTTKEQSWKGLARLISKCSNEDYHSFMSKFEELRLNNNTKEYFLRLRFYSEINKKTDVLRNLVDESNEDELIDEQTEINTRVIKRYKTQLGDFGKKEKYDDEESIRDLPKLVVSAADVKTAMSRVSFDKATGWDFIPGDVYKLIMDNEKDFDTFSERLSILFAELVNGEHEIPTELLLARLVCLNKSGDEKGRIDNIRPIAVNTMLVKILEQVVRERLTTHIEEKNLICRNQIGFRRKLSTDLNLMRLRQKTKEMKALNDTDEMFLFFIDFKQAYDSVPHRRLFSKMEQLGIPGELIRAIRKIYSNARISPTLIGVESDQDTIAVNVGVLQGGLNSPDLFNLYINDLLLELEGKVFEVLAYADDIVILCKSRPELEEAMRILSDWSIENGIDVNKKKSGVMPVHGRRVIEYELNGFPIKNNYKYLGMRIDSTLSPKGGLIELNAKLKEYLNRNNWIIRKYFTPKSLIILSKVFQESRIVYGLSSWLDCGDLIDMAQNASLKYIRGLLGLKHNVSKRRSRLVFGLPKMEHLLLCRLIDNVKKYVDHFGEFPSIYETTLKTYEKWSGIDTQIGFSDPKSFKKSICDKSMKQAAEAEGIEFGDRFKEIIHKHMYRFPDRRENLTTMWLLNWGFFEPRLFPVCGLCGGENSRKHVTNDCPFYEELRVKTLKQIGRVLHLGNLEKSGNLHDWLLNIYFAPGLKWNTNQMRGVVNVLKTFCASLYMDKSRKGRNNLKEDNGCVSDCDSSDVG